jgi:hypothetical protein
VRISSHCHPQRYSAKDLASNDCSARCFGVPPHDSFTRLALLAVLGSVVGCAHSSAPGTKSPSPSPATAATTSASSNDFPILYHRTGGIAGTDDRVVIWPDGVIQVVGRQLVPVNRPLNPDRLAHLHSLMNGWEKLKDEYLSAGVADAYTITITCGGKTIEATDLSPELPNQFRQVFSEIETIAAEAGSAPPPPIPVDNSAPTP